MAFLDETGLAELWSLVKENISKVSPKVGDVLYSINNLETRTSGEFISADGRTVAHEEYPDLTELEALALEIASPTNMPGASYTDAWSLSTRPSRHAFKLNGNYFWVSNSVSGDTTYSNWLIHYNPTTATWKKLKQNIREVCVCNNQVIAFYTASSTHKVYVYDSEGTQIRVTTMPCTQDSIYPDTPLVVGNHCVVAYTANWTSYAYWSDDNFATIGTTTWDSATSLSQGAQTGNSTSNAPTRSNMKEYNGKLYFFLHGSNADYFYCSEDGGETFTTLWSLDAGKAQTGTWFFYDGHLFSFNSKSANALQKRDLLTGEVLMSLEYGATSSQTDGIWLHGNELLDLATKVKINLDTMEVTQTITSSATVLTGAGSFLITSDGEWLLSTSSNASSYVTDHNGTKRYSPIAAYHIPTNQFTAFDAGSNGSAMTKGTIFEDPDGFIVRICGSKLEKWEWKDRVIPTIERGYIKAK